MNGDTISKILDALYEDNEMTVKAWARVKGLCEIYNSSDTLHLANKVVMRR